MGLMGIFEEGKGIGVDLNLLLIFIIAYHDNSLIRLAFCPQRRMSLVNYSIPLLAPSYIDY